MTANKIEKINGRLTKREVLRRMMVRGVNGEVSAQYNVKYIARRIDKTPQEARRMVHWMARHLLPQVKVHDVGAEVRFEYAEF